MKIETVKQLTAGYPELVTAIQNEAVESVDSQAKIDAEKNRIIGLAKAQMGDAGDKLEALINSGVTVEQFEAIKGTMPEQPKGKADEGESLEDKARREALELLRASGADNPGAGLGDGDRPQDFDGAVKAIMQAENIGKGQATKKAVEKYPELHDKYIESLK